MMKTFDELFNSLPEEDQKLIKSYADSRVSQGIKKYKENHIVIGDVEKRIKNLSTRLEKINAKKEMVEARNDLKVYALKKCNSNGLDFQIIESQLNYLKNNSEVDAEIEKIKSFKKNISENAIQTFIAKNNFKPSGGKVSEYLNLEELSTEKLIGLEGAGNLDRLIKNN